MRKTRLLSKKIWMLMAILFFGVVSTQAAAITYSLTTKVDGRTITGTANLSEGASLLNNMPQDLWRGYTTYKFYSDQDLTVEITTAPAEDATVYVDYEFDPPFLMSNDSKTVWNYLRNWNGGGSSHRFCYSENNRIYSRGHTSETHMKNDYTAHWAFYGDGYSFNLKNRANEKWAIWAEQEIKVLGVVVSRTYYHEFSSTKEEVGWQLYANTASNSHFSGGAISLCRPDNKKLTYLEDIGIALSAQNITSDHKFDSHNQVVIAHPNGGTSQVTQEKNELWWYAFFASPITESSETPDIWHVTYKIRKADGTWYNDIVIQKSSSNLEPSFPPAGFTRVEGCEYDYFYTDDKFTDKWPDETAMPNDRNTTLYIKEINYTSTPWMTLVLPFTISNTTQYFGDEAVEVNELTSVDGHLRELNGERYFSCVLHFSPATEILAYKPYLFKAKDVSENLLNWIQKIEEEEITIDENELDNHKITVTDETNAAGINVMMKGVLNSEGYTMPGDGLHFYFGSVKKGNDYVYNFYRRNVAVTIPQFRCFFYVEDTDASIAPLMVEFSENELTGISQMTSDTTVGSPIYNINGQKMRATKANELQKGLYIVNGKKIIVK